MMGQYPQPNGGGTPRVRTPTTPQLRPCATATKALCQTPPTNRWPEPPLGGGGGMGGGVLGGAIGAMKQRILGGFISVKLAETWVLGRENLVFNTLSTETTE